MYFIKDGKLTSYAENFQKIRIWGEKISFLWLPEGLLCSRSPGLVPRKACVNVCPSVRCVCDVTHRIGLQDCKIVLRAIFKKDRVLGFLWCFCKCVFSLCCSVLLDDCRWLMSRSRLQDCTIALHAIFWSFLGVIVNVFRVLGSKQMIEGCFNDVSQKL